MEKGRPKHELRGTIRRRQMSHRTEEPINVTISELAIHPDATCPERTFRHQQGMRFADRYVSELIDMEAPRRQSRYHAKHGSQYDGPVSSAGLIEASGAWQGILGGRQTARIRRRRAGCFHDQTDTIRTGACIRFAGPLFS